MKFKRHDLSPLKRFFINCKTPILGFISGFSFWMMISAFSINYSFFAGIIVAIIFYGLANLPDL
jgi:hypothetical protein